MIRCIQTCLRKIHYYSWKWKIDLARRTFFGRLFHGGISKPDLWSVDMFLAPKIAKTIKRFAEMDRHGIPIAVMIDPEHEDSDYYVEFWDAILWKMVDGFERMGNDEICCQSDTIYEQEALELFAEFFMNMWD